MHPSLRSSSMTHGESRQQSRQSPLYLVSAGRDVIGGRRFDLDPASNAQSIVDARFECWYGGKPGRCPYVRSASSSERITRYVGDGLLLDWDRHRHIFINPPWGNMAPFIAKAHEFAAAMRAAGETDWSIQMLVPLRPHRNYWAPAYSADAWCLLKPVRFIGFEEQMPTPCAWLYWGSDVKRFRRVFHLKQGVVLTTLPRVSSLTSMLPSENDEKEPFARLLEIVLRGQLPDMLADVLRSCDDVSVAELMQLCKACEGHPFEDLITKATYTVLEDTALGTGAGSNYVLWNEADSGQREKTTSKRAASKKTAKRTSAKKTSKRSSSGASGGKKTASKASAPKASAPKTPPKKKTTPRPSLKLSDGTVAKSGTKVIRRGTEEVGIVRGIEGSCAKVEWSGRDFPVKVIASDLEKAPAAERSQAKGKVARLLEAIETEILMGRATEFSCAEVARAMNVSVSTATRALNKLISAGKCEKTGTGRKSAYLSLVPEDDKTSPANDSGAGAA